MTSHRDTILDQFTRQAAPFAACPHITDEASLRLVVEWSGAGPGDTVLDVACGAGHVVCAFARTVRHATGILGRCFPDPRDAGVIRGTFAAALRDDRLGIPTRLEAGRIHVAYPIAVLAAVRSA